MFSNFFGSSKKKTVVQKSNNNEIIPQMPQGHQQYSENDKDKCPYFQFNKNTSPEQEIRDSDTEQAPIKEKKQKKPKGGCPFMPSDNKKNPPLQSMTEGFDLIFISPFEYLLEYRGMLSFAFDSSNIEKMQNRKVFESYPIYLKHTLMHDEENMKKVRTLEIGQRFFVYDKFREKGNKEFYKGNLESCQQYYERALGCFKWLEYKEDEEKKEEPQKQTKEQVQEDDAVRQRKEEENKEEQDIYESVKDFKFTEKDKEEIKEMSKKMKEESEKIKKEYKSLIKSYHDENVILMDGQELSDTQDLDMRKSMLQTIFMLMSVSYMKQFHFSLALQVLEDAKQISDKSSQIYFRRSQALSYNKFSNMKQLLEAKSEIEKALHMKAHEKIFKSEPGILKILNLENHEEVYIEQASYCVKRIHDRIEWETERVTKMLKRIKQIQIIEKRIIDEGKVPQWSMGEEDMEDLEFSVVKEMINKYYKAIEFYTETKKPDQVKMAKDELQKTLVTYVEMEYYLSFDFTDTTNDIVKKVNGEFELDLTSDKIKDILMKIRREKAKEIFENGKFNFEMYKYALEDFFKKRSEKKKKLEEEQKQDEKPEKTRNWVGSVFSAEFLMQMIVIVFLVLIGMLFYKDNKFVQDIFLQLQGK